RSARDRRNGRRSVLRSGKPNGPELLPLVRGAPPTEAGRARRAQTERPRRLAGRWSSWPVSAPGAPPLSRPHPPGVVFSLAPRGPFEPAPAPLAHEGSGRRARGPEPGRAAGGSLARRRVTQATPSGAAGPAGPPGSGSSGRVRRLFLDTTPLREHREFRLLWLGQGVSGVGNPITRVA